MKGIILAGGKGTRLYPLTKTISKQLLPVYDKPMIYYSLSVLMLAGIKEILIISTPRDIENYIDLLGDGSFLGISIKYRIQDKPRGLADAFIIGEDFVENEDVCLILGDNIFYGNGMQDILKEAIRNLEKNICSIFSYYVSDPKSYGVVEVDENDIILSIEEKPQKPKSNYAVTGLYFYTNEVIEVAKEIKPSKRNEIEITSVNSYFLKNKKLKNIKLGRGFAWFDTGTHESLFEASYYVKSLEKRQGLKISCIEEIALDMKYISKEDLNNHLLKKKINSDYYNYVKKLIK